MQRCPQVSVAILLAVPRQHIVNATRIPGRELIHIIKKHDLHDPGDNNHYLSLKSVQKVYILEADAEIKGFSNTGGVGNGDVWPENVARFSEAEMATAWHNVEESIRKSHVLVAHFTSLESAALILSEGSHGLRASKAGQGGGGLSVVYVDDREGGASMPSPPAAVGTPTRRSIRAHARR